MFVVTGIKDGRFYKCIIELGQLVCLFCVFAFFLVTLKSFSPISPLLRSEHFQIPIRSGTLKNCFPNKFSKTTITVRLNLLHVYPPVPHFVFVALFIPYFHVLSSHFYISLTFLAVTTG